MNRLSEEKVNEIKLDNNFQTLGSLDLSGGMVCDVETGICGPADEMELNKENKKESLNENNSMV